LNFLVDVNLPPGLCDWLRHRGQQAVHLADVRGLRMPDGQVWQRAGAAREVIVTKDADFRERSLVFGQPPQVLLVAVGNCSNQRLFKLLDAAWPQIDSELRAGCRLVVLHPTRLEVHL
jgi:predicted nuclease of predicted toxin-antitoxin system